MELDLSTVVPSIAGPKRPQDRIELSRSKEQFEHDLLDYADPGAHTAVDAAVEGTFPASDPLGFTPQDETSPGEPREVTHQHEHAAQSLSHAPSTVSPPPTVPPAHTASLTPPPAPDPNRAIPSPPT